MKALKNKIPAEQYAEMYDIKVEKKDKEMFSKKFEHHESKTEIEEEPQPEPEAVEEEIDVNVDVEADVQVQEKPKEEKKKIASDKQKRYGKILDDISGSLKAVLFDEKGKEIDKIPVRQLTDTLKKKSDIYSVVFDGIITQRLLDIANNKNIKEIIGIKIGNVVKKPASVEVFTRKDLQ
jgi:hypothetical protein